MPKNPTESTLNKGHIVTKVIWHCFLIVAEIIGVALLFYKITDCIFPCTDIVQIIERLLMGFAIYEATIILILTNVNDTRKDSLLALKSSYELAVLFIETNDDRIKLQLYNQIDRQLDTGTLNYIDVRNNYIELKTLLEAVDINIIRAKLLFISHEYESRALAWRFSIIVQLFK
jgi:hypothetical protein